MRKKIIILITVLFIFSISGCGFLAKRYTKSETSEYRFNISGKKKLHLENVSGNINVHKSSDDSKIVVKAVKEAKVKKQDLDKPFEDAKIDIDSNSDVISVSTDIKRKGGFKLFSLGGNVKVEYDLYIPEGIEIEIENVNGDIYSKNLSNNLDISLVNGDVEVENYSGELDCEVTNGSFKGEIDLTSGMNISIINGGVSLSLNSFMDANITAETVNGKITDENLPLRDVKKEKKKFRAKLGDKETNVEINIETVNGKIKLLGKNEI